MVDGLQILFSVFTMYQYFAGTGDEEEEEKPKDEEEMIGIDNPALKEKEDSD